MADALQRELLALVPPAVGIVVTGLALAWIAVPRKLGPRNGPDPRFGPSKCVPQSPRSTSHSDDEEELDPGRLTNIHGTLIPSEGLIIGNSPKAYPFENELCKGYLLPMHKPTKNADRMASGQYLHGGHFHGRKRLWEFRLQFQFKRAVQGNMLFGVELDDYVPLNPTAKRLMGMTVSALRQVVGSDLYHSVGDDPASSPAPHEKPVFMMPLWAFDQFVVTPEGEEPPDLSDPNFSKYGSLRADDRKQFVQKITELELVPGPTYTFAVWGISQFLDCVKWELTKIIPFKPIDFNLFCGAPPVHVVMYTLNTKGALEGEKRHLQTRKSYFLRFALWSPLHKPTAAKIRELIPNDGDLGSRRGRFQSASKKGFLERMFGCCASERPH
mmetsp:Transcript_46598/g.135708  ORF Transcript_46598/g.135708 Transcript_46598/m.135708 type:complete len:385 (+) Transcript_46598:144-1298(+)